MILISIDEMMKLTTVAFSIFYVEHCEFVCGEGTVSCAFIIIMVFYLSMWWYPG